MGNVTPHSTGEFRIDEEAGDFKEFRKFLARIHAEIEKAVALPDDWTLPTLKRGKE